jgi:thiamine biosynthesis protein ThiS
MKIKINGQSYNIAQQKEQNVKQALNLFLNTHQDKSTFAVALNSSFVDKNDYQQTMLSENDLLDVLFPIQGG